MTHRGLLKRSRGVGTKQTQENRNVFNGAQSDIQTELVNPRVAYVQTQFRREQLLLDRRLQMPRQSVRVTSVVHPLPQRQLARVVEVAQLQANQLLQDLVPAVPQRPLHHLPPKEATPIQRQQVVPVIAEVVSRSHTLLRGSSEQQIAQLASKLQMV
jgi:hypothetical protein